MFSSEPRPKIKSIRSSDPDWMIDNGLVIAPRAGLEICSSMPYEYKLIITECINKGWVRPIAYQPAHEEFMEKLTK